MSSWGLLAAQSETASPAPHRTSDSQLIPLAGVGGSEREKAMNGHAAGVSGGRCPRDEVTVVNPGLIARSRTMQQEVRKCELMSVATARARCG